MFPNNRLPLPLNVALLQYSFMFLKVRIELIENLAQKNSWNKYISYPEYDKTRTALLAVFDLLGYDDVVVDRGRIGFNKGGFRYSILA